MPSNLFRTFIMRVGDWTYIQEFFSLLWSEGSSASLLALFCPCCLDACLLLHGPWSLVIINAELILYSRPPFPRADGLRGDRMASLYFAFFPALVAVDRKYGLTFASGPCFHQWETNLKFKTSFPLNPRGGWMEGQQPRVSIDVQAVLTICLPGFPFPLDLLPLKFKTVLN